MTTITKAGPLRVRLFGGAEDSGGDGGPAILLCHGFGAPGDDLCDLARVCGLALGRALGAGVRWIFPEAPIALDLGFGAQGRAWWHLDMARLSLAIQRGERLSLADEAPEGLAEARTALEACIDDLVRSQGVRRDRLLVGGFSQGGMLATEVALFAPEPFAGLAVLSGTLLSQSRWRRAAKATGASLHAFISHGRADPLLSFQDAGALRQMLEEAGAKVDWAPHEGQHEIPMATLERFAAFASARLR